MSQPPIWLWQMCCMAVQACAQRVVRIPVHTVLGSLVQEPACALRSGHVTL